MTRPRVVVVGGGLAGLAAAISCADGGGEVTLLESKPRLGGLTWSFERNGLWFDNGQHVHLRCCTAYRAFLARIGSEAKAPLQERLDVPVLRPRPGSSPVLAHIRRNGAPAPFHLAPALVRYRHLSLADRLRLGPAVLALRRVRLGDPALDTSTFGSFLAGHHQRASAVDGLFDLIALPTLNLRSHEASLALAAMVFKTGLLTETAAADIGWSHVPLARLHAEPALAVLSGAGARVRRRTKVTAVRVSGGTATGVVTAGGEIDADAVVLAVPHTEVAAVLPTGALPDAAGLARLGTSPIVNVHVVYDRRVTTLALAAGVGSPIQYVFDRTAASGLADAPADPGAAKARGGPQCLAVSLSGADEYLGRQPADLIDLVTSGLAGLFPAARRARVLDAVVTRERSATFRALPGTASLRPGPGTGVRNLYLAGAWTDTGWPATMEGAVRSGNLAAELALRGAAGERRRPVGGGWVEDPEEPPAPPDGLRTAGVVG